MALMAAPQSRLDVVRAIEHVGVVAVVRLPDAAQAQEVAGALVTGGVTAIEITMTVSGAVELIAALARTAPPEVIVGAGTVLDAATARAVIDAGAAFVVSPVFKPEVVGVCREAGRAVMPGCFTPTEILQAWEAGADVVKVFPATSLGPAFFGDLLAPMPWLKLMPTGGVSLANAEGWIRAGAVAVGVGSALVDRAAVREGRLHDITAKARAFVDAVAAARGRAAQAVAR
jgi:2-dehydro-3-deoxyphosphogluconate aldolase/(4S)-4-hydroxy-2-oxoglutarate aldolase